MLRRRRRRRLDRVRAVRRQQVAVADGVSAGILGEPERAVGNELPARLAAVRAGGSRRGGRLGGAAVAVQAKLVNFSRLRRPEERKKSLYEGN
jgi:predicted ATPase